MALLLLINEPEPFSMARLTFNLPLIELLRGQRACQGMTAQYLETYLTGLAGSFCYLLSHLAITRNTSYRQQASTAQDLNAS